MYKESFDTLLSQARTAQGPSLTGIAKIIEALSHYRNYDDNWRMLIEKHIQPHPLTEWLRQCPLTERTASKPRGYAGDAVMIDLIYGTGTNPAPAEHVDTKAIFSYTSSSPPCKAVRYRRYRLADLVDKAAIDAIHRGQHSIRVLSVAAGHAREMLLSTAFRHGLVSEFVALDQDAESLEEITKSLGHYGAQVTPVASSIRLLLTGQNALGKFDVVYAAGLYDYLESSVAKRLTSNMFAMLNPAGRLLYANFAADIASAGYMEAIMDWWLIFRDPIQTVALSSDIPSENIAKINSYSDPDRQIHFVELTKV